MLTKHSTRRDELLKEKERNVKLYRNSFIFLIDLFDIFSLIFISTEYINKVSSIFVFFFFFERSRRQQGTTLKNVTPISTHYNSPVTLYGLRMEHSEANVEYNELGVPQLLIQRNASFRFFGDGWTEHTLFMLTEKKGVKGSPCEYPRGEVQEVNNIIFYSNYHSTIVLLFIY